jgi:hypothetical protein
MRNHRLHHGVWVAPNSELFALLEAADKSKKPEDRKKAEDHAKQLDAKFLQQCGLTKDNAPRNWSIGKGYA